jgi:hypothetical protein
MRERDDVLKVLQVKLLEEEVALLGEKVLHLLQQ